MQRWPLLKPQRPTSCEYVPVVWTVACVLELKWPSGVDLRVNFFFFKWLNTGQQERNLLFSEERERRALTFTEGLSSPLCILC